MASTNELVMAAAVGAGAATLAVALVSNRRSSEKAIARAVVKEMQQQQANTGAHEGPVEDKEYTDAEEGGKIKRRRTVAETEVMRRSVQAKALAANLPDDSSLRHVDMYMPQTLEHAIFCGHLVTDLDSIAGAIGAAELYGGVPARASEVNSETQFALERWGAEVPRAVEELLAAEPNAPVCLVDHQQTSQLNPAINTEQIVGVIDHHALQSKTIVTDKPIYLDIRPWGSMSTIIAHSFIMHQRRPSDSTAGMLLSAILSDTLNLLGPTTTEWDRIMVAVLCELTGVDDINLLASQQFKAKSKELAGLSAVGLVNGDQKAFGFNTDAFTGEVGFAVVETTDDAVIMDRREELVAEMMSVKKEKGLTLLFLAVVNIVELRSQLLLCGGNETLLATESFGGALSSGNTVMDLGKRVSRKKDFVPALTRTIKNGWAMSSLPRGPSVHAEIGVLVVDPHDPHSRPVRKASTDQAAEAE